MDWYAWLSQTNLDAALINHYALTLVRNDLHEDHLPYFNHHFLQSLGISVAKHRLEILKLCKTEPPTPNHGLSRLVLVVNKTRKLFARNISKLGFHKPAPYRSQWSGALRRISCGSETQQGGGNVAWSEPLDRRLMRGQSVSGPLDHVKMCSPMVGRGNERSGLACQSPNMSGLSPRVGGYRSEMMGDRAHSLWSIMFHDMKPN